MHMLIDGHLKAAVLFCSILIKSSCTHRHMSRYMRMTLTSFLTDAACANRGVQLHLIHDTTAQLARALKLLRPALAQ